MKLLTNIRHKIAFLKHSVATNCEICSLLKEKNEIVTLQTRKNCNRAKTNHTSP